MGELASRLGQHDSWAVMLNVIGATGALGLAAVGLVDALKAIPYIGVSDIGLGVLRRGLTPFSPALTSALGGGDWKQVIRAHWINGRSRDEQKAIVRSLLRLGLTPDTASALAKAGNLDGELLATVATKLAKGDPLDSQEVDVLGRLDASLEAHMDAAFDLAEQQYKNLSRVIAGVIAIALSVSAAMVLSGSFELEPGDWLLAGLVGIVAVPLAPIAKDLTSALSAAANAFKAAKAG